MEANTLPNSFFRKNPLEKLSAAILLNFSAGIELEDKLQNEMYRIADASLTDERRIQLEQDRREIEAITTGEDVARYMRGNFDVMSNPLLSKKALSLIEDAAPHIIRRYLTTAQDRFIESAFRIFVHADKRYAEELYAAYPNIRNAYAQAVACLLFGKQDMWSALPLLLREYQRFQAEYPDECFAQFPLLAIYILHKKA